MVVRKSSAKWDKEHMATLSCRVTKERAAQFREACQKIGTSMNAVFLKAISAVIKEAEDQE